MSEIPIGTELSIVFETTPQQLDLFVGYRKLGETAINGVVWSPQRFDDLVINPALGLSIMKEVEGWIQDVRSTQVITPNIHPDVPIEYRMGYVPSGIDFNMESGILLEEGTLDITIHWERATDVVTIYAYQAFKVSLETFIFYVDRIFDMFYAIANDTG